MQSGHKVRALPEAPKKITDKLSLGEASKKQADLGGRKQYVFFLQDQDATRFQNFQEGTRVKYLRALTSPGSGGGGCNALNYSGWPGRLSHEPGRENLC